MPKMDNTPAQRAIRLAGSVLERTAPGLAAILAERILFRLPPRAPLHRRLVPHELPLGEPFAVSHDGRQIRGTVWGNGPAIYLVHGRGGWGTQLAAYVRPLANAGFRVVAYDALSHGESDAGRSGPLSSDPLEATASLHAVVTRFGTPYAIVAHSMGAIVVANAIRTGLPAPRRLVFVAAANTYDPSLNLLIRLTGIGPRVRRRLLRRVHQRLGLPFHYFDAAGIFSDLLAERGTLPPLLCLHDIDDPEVPYAGSVTISEGWPDARLHGTKGLGHLNILRDPTVTQLATTFLTQGATFQIHP